MKKKKPYNLTRKIVVSLRAIHRGWPFANECLKNAKQGKNSYRCESCDRNFRRELLRKDHIDPIGLEPKLVNGAWLPSWDSYINSMFSPNYNYQALCLDCHDAKTKEENLERKKKRSLQNNDSQ